jgi:hypothetical protein
LIRKGSFRDTRRGPHDKKEKQNQKIGKTNDDIITREDLPIYVFRRQKP